MFNACASGEFAIIDLGKMFAGENLLRRKEADTRTSISILMLKRDRELCLTFPTQKGSGRRLSADSHEKVIHFLIEQIIRCIPDISAFKHLA